MPGRPAELVSGGVAAGNGFGGSLCSCPQAVKGAGQLARHAKEHSNDSVS